MTIPGSGRAPDTSAQSLVVETRDGLREHRSHLLQSFDRVRYRLSRTRELFVSSPLIWDPAKLPSYIFAKITFQMQREVAGQLLIPSAFFHSSDPSSNASISWISLVKSRRKRAASSFCIATKLSVEFADRTCLSNRKLYNSWLRDTRQSSPPEVPHADHYSRSYRPCR